MVLTAENNQRVSIQGPLSAFGDLQVIESSPVVQIEAVNGLRPKTDVETFTATGGSVSAVNSAIAVRATSGTTDASASITWLEE